MTPRHGANIDSAARLARWRRRGLLAALAMATLAAPSRGANQRLAVLVSQRIKAIERAVGAIRDLDGVRATEFDLSQGTSEIDRARAELRAGRFDAVVALGTRAHDFYTAEGLEYPYRATLVLGHDSDPSVVPIDPSPEDWAALFGSLLPPKARIGAIASSQEAKQELRALAEELGRIGLQLEVKVPGPRQAISRVTAEMWKRCNAFFFTRDKAIMNKKAAVSILQGAQNSRVPVFAFSAGLVKAGALVSLEISPEAAARHAAALALGKAGDDGAETDLTLNRSRADYLRVKVPRDLAARAKAP